MTDLSVYENWFYEDQFLIEELEAEEEYESTSPSRIALI